MLATFTRRATPTSARSACTGSAPGKQPACVSICPTKALEFGDLSDPQSDVSQLLKARKHKTLQTERGLSPNVYFLS